MSSKKIILDRLMNTNPGNYEKLQRYHKDAVHYSYAEVVEESYIKLSILTIIDKKTKFFSYLESSSKIKKISNDHPINEWVKVNIEENPNGDYFHFAFDLKKIGESRNSTDNEIQLLFNNRVNFHFEHIRLEDHELQMIEGLLNEVQLDDYECGAEELEYIKRTYFKKLDVKYLTVYNVGQGSLSAPCDRHNMPLFYFDLGGEFYNAGPRSYRLLKRKICFSDRQPVLISHWDMDHYSQLFFYNNMTDLVLAPRPDLIGQFQRYIIGMLLLNGNLRIVPDIMQPMLTNNLSILKSNVNVARDRNNNGIYCILKLKHTNKKVLLPGDANYTNLPEVGNTAFFSVIASHHGGFLTAVARRQANFYPLPDNEKSMLVFSHGRKRMRNLPRRHDHHPYEEEVVKYKSHGWRVRNIHSTFFGDVVVGTLPRNVYPPCGGGCDSEIELW